MIMHLRYKPLIDLQMVTKWHKAVEDRAYMCLSRAYGDL